MPTPAKAEALFDKGLDSHPDANATKDLPDALATIDRLTGPTLALLLDIHPCLNHPLTSRAMKNLALKGETICVQLALVGHAVTVPPELGPWASRLALDAMNPQRVQQLLREAISRQRLRAGQDVTGCARTLESLQRHLAGLAESAVRHLARLALGDGDDTGAARRLLGTLLTWMAERRSRVFLVATANDIETLPPALLRKGRFDEIFFIDLPGADTRGALLQSHLGKLKLPLPDADPPALVAASDGFPSAEEQAAALRPWAARRAVAAC